VDIPQCLLEVEVRVYFLRRDAGVVAQGQALVVGFDLGTVDGLDQYFHVAQLGVGKALGELVGLAPAVADLLQLHDGVLAGQVRGRAGSVDVAGVPGVGRLLVV
jgi:hypothetical protein